MERQSIPAFYMISVRGCAWCCQEILLQTVHGWWVEGNTTASCIENKIEGVWKLVKLCLYDYNPAGKLNKRKAREFTGGWFDKFLLCKTARRDSQAYQYQPIQFIFHLMFFDQQPFSARQVLQSKRCRTTPLQINLNDIPAISKHEPPSVWNFSNNQGKVHSQDACGY